MTPIVARRKWTDEIVLVLDVQTSSAGRLAVIVSEGGQLGTCDLEEVVVERPTVDFPLGYRFSRAQMEYVDTAEVARR